MFFPENARRHRQQQQQQHLGKEQENSRPGRAARSIQDAYMLGEEAEQHSEQTSENLRRRGEKGIWRKKGRRRRIILEIVM